MKALIFTSEPHAKGSDSQGLLRAILGNSHVHLSYIEKQEKLSGSRLSDQ